MLVLTRKQGEKIKIGDHVTVTVLAVRGGVIKLGIEAPPDVRILRGELSDWVESASKNEVDPARPAEAIAV